MKFNHVLLMLRAAAFIAAAGFIAANARGYLLNWLGLSVTPGVYALGAFAFIWIVLWLSTKKLFNELKVDARSRRSPVTDIRQNARENSADTVHRYPLRLGYLVATIGVVIFFLPYLSVESGSSIAFVTYVGCFGAACIVALIDFYIFTYTVTIKSDKIVVKAFVTREFLFADIAKTDVVTTKNGPQAVVLLKDGKVIRFGGVLTGFPGMLKTLVAKTSRRAID